MSSATVWLAEDEAAIADTLVYMLQQEGFTPRWFPRGLLLMEALQQQIPDLVILDVGLPDISGFELCRQLLIQLPDLPVLFLTARSEEIDRLLGLEMGADDYVAKPFSPREVCARVRSLLRRLQKQQRIAQPRLHSVARFTLDEAAMRITWCQQPLSLTRYEYLLLKTLLLSPGRVFSRQQLMDLVWQSAEESMERTVDTHVKTLRAKLREINADEAVLMTHRGLGYSLLAER